MEVPWEAVLCMEEREVREEDGVRARFEDWLTAEVEADWAEGLKMPK